MRNLRNIFVLVVAIFVAKSHSKSADPSCNQWHGIADNINAMNFLHLIGEGTSMACKKHVNDCEQMDCSGHFNGTGIPQANWDFDFCWGVKLNPCNDPISMDTHLLIPSKNVNFTPRISHDDKVAVPGMSAKASLGEIALYLVFSFEKFMKKNKTEYVTISITARLKVTLFTEEEWPDSLKLDILPKTNFTVRHCSKLTNRTSPSNLQCQKTVTNNTSTTTTMAPVYHIMSNTYNKTCTLTLTSHCGANEMCQKEADKTTGRCICEIDHYLCVETGYCQTKDDCLNHKIPTTLPSVTGKISQTTVPTVHKTSISNTALIVGSVLGGIILVVIIGVVIVFCKKRGNSRYQGRQLLLTEDDTDGII